MRSERALEERVAELERLVAALTMELRAHHHNALSDAYKVLFPEREEIAAVRGSDGSEMPL